jgi:hypothetical protein
MILSLKGLYVTLSITDTHHYNALLHYTMRLYAECRVLFIVMLSVILLSALILNVIMLSAIYSQYHLY